MSGRYSLSENNLKQKYPNIAKYWHPTKNGELDPSMISPKSNKKVWWICDEKHEYQRIVGHQIERGGTCPVCSGRLYVYGINDIKTKFPQIAEDWDYEENNPKRPDDYTFASATTVGWKCKICGHTWKAPINCRCNQNRGCCICAGKKRWNKRREKMLVGITDPALLEEWDYELNEKGPESYTPHSNASVHWICQKCGYRYVSKINNKANGRKCACCQRKIVVPGINDLATTHPEIAKEWDYEKNGDLKPQDVLAGTRRKVFWKCAQGHSYSASVNHRTTPGRETNCPRCNDGRQTSFAEQAVYYYVKKLYPDSVNRYKEIFSNGMELDIYIPSIKVAIEYDGEAWHKQEKSEREKKKYIICQENGIRLIRLIEKMRPDEKIHADEGISIEDGPMYEPINLQKVIRLLLDMLDPESNPWSRKNPFHIHSDIDINIERDKAEIRKYMTALKGSLAEKNPELVKEWDYEFNGSLTPDKVKPGSDIKAGWICSICGKRYMATIGKRTGKNPTGCPECGIKKNAMKRSKAVGMIDLRTGKIIREFASSAEASREMNISRGNIGEVCRNNGRTQAGGFGWKYI